MTMSADHVAVLVASIASGAGTVVLAVAVTVLVRRVRELRRVVEELRLEAVPLVRDARVIADQAATELVRVGDVLDSAEAVSTTVDSASRLAYRMFANPVVKVLAYGTGVGSALRRFFGRGAARRAAGSIASNGHRADDEIPQRVPRVEDTARRRLRRRRQPSRSNARRRVEVPR
jgi:hypothetical protein